MMSLSDVFIRRPVGTTLLAIGLFLAGLVAYQFLPVANVPSVDFPVVRVSASRPGADPAVMAATVAAPLERRLGEIAGVTQLTSTSSLGSTNISVQFVLGRNIDRAARDVQAAINAAASDLPSDLHTLRREHCDQRCHLYCPDREAVGPPLPPSASAGATHRVHLSVPSGSL